MDLFCCVDGLLNKDVVPGIFFWDNTFYYFLFPLFNVIAAWVNAEAACFVYLAKSFLLSSLGLLLVIIYVDDDGSYF